MRKESMHGGMEDAKRNAIKVKSFTVLVGFEKTDEAVWTTEGLKP